MVTHKPVPSRAAINALRGIIFTTSCSVILLAEERRRRTKIARSAIDNARKLHTVQTRPRSSPLQEVRFAELDDDVRAALPTILGKRKRQVRSQGVPSSESHVSTEIDTPNLPSSPPDVSRLSPSINQDLLSGALRALDLKSTRPQRQSDQHKPSRVTQTTLSFAQQISANRSRATDHFHALSDYRPPRAKPKPVVKDPGHELEEFLSVVKKLATSSGASLDLGRIFHGILDEIDEWAHPPRRVQEALEAALDILEADEYQKRTREPTLMDVDYFRLLQSAIVSEAPNSRNILERVLRARSTSVNFIHDVVTWLAEGQRVQQLSLVLGMIVHHSSTDRAREGCKVLNILKTRKQSAGSFRATVGLYNILLQGGLFDLAELQNDEKYAISEFMATEAMEAGDYVVAKRQWNNMLAFDAQRCASHAYDFCSRIVHQRVVHRVWSEDQSVAKEKLCNLLCEGMLRSRDPGAVERMIRGLVSRHFWKVHQAWIYPIMDWHSGRNDERALLSWLMFALSNHQSLDEEALDMAIARYRQLYNTSSTNGDMGNLFKHLRDAGIDLPQWNNAEASEKRNSIEAVLRSKRTGSLQMGPQTKTSEPRAAKEGQMITSMQRLSRARKWHQAVVLYQRYEAETDQFSLGCLQEAVEAQLRLGPDGWKEARNMLDRAYNQGHNVNEVAERILSRRLHDGADPDELIAEATAWGLQISDTMYNAAFKSLSRQGNMSKAKSICTAAAQDIGAGDLLFSDWNFSNLLFALVGLGPRGYSDMESLIAEFLSVDRAWQGTKMCKEAIKLAMKALAARAVADDKLARRHEKALHKLAEALVHSRQVRAKHSAARGQHSSAPARQSEDKKDSHTHQDEPLPIARIHGEPEPSSMADEEIYQSDTLSYPLSAAVGAG